MSTAVSTHVLEEAAQAFADATSNPPFLYDLGPEKGREVVNQTQAGEIAKPNVTDEWIKVSGGPRGDVDVRIVRPAGATGTLPVILYIHGAGWVFGNAGTHDRLVRELAIGANAAVVFPEYSLSPEAKYPVALEECYAVARWVAEGAPGKGLDTSRVAIAGDSCGGNLAAAVTLLAKERGDITFAAQALLYPVTDANFDDGSYLELQDTQRLLLHRGSRRAVLGIMAYLGFDVLMLWGAFLAVHAHPVPSIPVVITAYIIGALGGSIPCPPPRARLAGWPGCSSCMA